RVFHVTGVQTCALPISIWAGIVAVITSVLMYIGRYDFIQVASTIMVGTFTAVTIGTVVMLQVTDWSISWESIRSGLTFRLPPVEIGRATCSEILLLVVA